ncbi:MAG: sugar ABC transporter substrate-binding protein [Spirochaetales bacterium]|nr:sugar ABC transporter substrate-binding protein [Spirochaetales bacterium]
MSVSKKLLAGLALVVLVSALGWAAGEQEGAETPGEKAYFFGHGTLYMGDEWMKVTDKAIHYYCEDQGWEVVTLNPDLNAEQQIKDIHSFVAQGVDGIIWSPVDSKACAAAAEWAKSQGVPTVTYNTDVDTSAVPITIMFDSKAAAVTLAETIVADMKAQSGQVKGVVISLQGDASNDADRARAQGFKEVFTQYPDINFVEFFTRSKMDVAQQNTFNAIQQFGRPAAIVSQNTTNSRGGMNALESQGMLVKRGERNHVYIASIGGAPDYLDLMKEGLCDYGFVQPNLFYGPLALALLKTVIEEGEDALPAIGTTVTEDDLKITGGVHEINPWKDQVWAPAEVGTSFGHRWLQVKGMMVTPDNVEDPRIWGNAARAWLK